jgi:hypothetical protein
MPKTVRRDAAAHAIRKGDTPPAGKPLLRRRCPGREAETGAEKGGGTTEER